MTNALFIDQRIGEDAVFEVVEGGTPTEVNFDVGQMALDGRAMTIKTPTYVAFDIGQLFIRGNFMSTGASSGWVVLASRRGR